MLDIFDFIVVNHIMLYENCLDKMMTLENFSKMLYGGLTGGDHSKNIIIESGSTRGESCTFFTCTNSRTSVSDCACSSCFPYLKVDCSIGFLFSWKVVFGSLASTSWFIVRINVLNLIGSDFSWKIFCASSVEYKLNKQFITWHACVLHQIDGLLIFLFDQRHLSANGKKA